MNDYLFSGMGWEPTDQELFEMDDWNDEESEDSEPCNTIQSE